MTAPPLSVVICSHNPRREYLARVLDALRNQTLSQEHWDLTLVDNASDPPISTWVDLSWHKRCRILIEAELGLTPARQRGISETSGDVIVFVDDDNVLDDDYLECSLGISASWPRLGSWGAGRIEPEFEVQPCAKLAPFMGWLALRSEREDRWSNNPADHSSLPWGVGLCVRRSVSRRYLEECASNPLGKALDRRGTSLMSGGDVLLALSARYLGMGWGLFVQLKVTHLIPSFRVTEDYVVRMAEQMALSSELVMFIVDPGRSRNEGTIKHWVKLAYHNVRLRLSGDYVMRSILNASARGSRSAGKIIDGIELAKSIQS